MNVNALSPLLADASPVAAPVGMATGLLLMATTSRVRRASLEQLLSLRLSERLGALTLRGWWIREAGPRNFAVWRGSDLVTRSSMAALVLPDGNHGLTAAERTLIWMIETERRFRVIAAAERGVPPVDPWCDTRLLQQLAELALPNRLEFLGNPGWAAGLRRKLLFAPVRHCGD